MILLKGRIGLLLPPSEIAMTEKREYALHFLEIGHWDFYLPAGRQVR